MGRPSIYSEELAEKILARIADGESVLDIADDASMPAAATIYVWARKHPDFQDRYTRARMIQAERMFEDLVRISDGGGDVARDRLRVDTRKWFLSKLAPKIYGDRIQHEDVTDSEHVRNITVELVPGKDAPADS